MGWPPSIRKFLRTPMPENCTVVIVIVYLHYIPSIVLLKGILYYYHTREMFMV